MTGKQEATDSSTKETIRANCELISGLQRCCYQPEHLNRQRVGLENCMENKMVLLLMNQWSQAVLQPFLKVISFVGIKPINYDKDILFLHKIILPLSLSNDSRLSPALRFRLRGIGQLGTGLRALRGGFELCCESAL